jgi:hypothetical protein
LSCPPRRGGVVVLFARRNAAGVGCFVCPPQRGGGWLFCLPAATRRGLVVLFARREAAGWGTY